MEFRSVIQVDNMLEPLQKLNFSRQLMLKSVQIATIVISNGKISIIGTICLYLDRPVESTASYLTFLVLVLFEYTAVFFLQKFCIVIKSSPGFLTVCNKYDRQHPASNSIWVDLARSRFLSSDI